MRMHGWHTKPDGWWFTYASAADYRCPYNITAEEASEDVRRTIAEFAERLGMLPDKLLVCITRGSRHGERARIDGRLTDRCNGCGARMENLGYAVRVERPVEESEDTDGERISRRIFGGAIRTVKAAHMPTKKEARQWAYEEYRIHRAVQQEEGE